MEAVQDKEGRMKQRKHRVVVEITFPETVRDSDAETMITKLIQDWQLFPITCKSFNKVVASLRVKEREARSILPLGTDAE
jgi:hypothetical protein